MNSYFFLTKTIFFELNALKLHMHQLFSISSQLCSPQPKYTDMTLPKLIFDEAVKADVEAGLCCLKNLLAGCLRLGKFSHSISSSSVVQQEEESGPKRK